MLLGLDIGGTKIAGALLSVEGAVQQTSWTTHSARGPEEVAAALATAAQDLTATQQPDTPHAPGRPHGGGDLVVGVSVSGLVAQSGRVTHAAVLQLDDDDLGGRISALIGGSDSSDVAVTVVNDADATLVAASADDPDQPVNDAILLTLGTGVGGAVLSGGRLIQGPTGYAGELGHLPVSDPLDYLCVCGSSGCLEQLASGRGLRERVRADPGAATISAWAETTDAALTSVHVVAAARAGIRPAIRLVEDAAQAIGHALAVLSVTFEPSTVYLGGSLAHAASDLLLPSVHRRLNRQLPFAALRRPPAIRLDDIGPTAAAIGAARLARQRVRPHSPAP